MRWQIRQCRVVGGMRPAAGNAPFARGAAVLERIDAPGRFLQVRGYAGAEAEGDELDAEQWAGFVSSSQAMALGEPVPAQSAASLWLFRSAFPDRDEALARLTQSGAVLHDAEVVASGVVAAVVREDLGDAVRDVLAQASFDRAWSAAQAGRWSEALTLADLSCVLSRGLLIERVALLSLAMERMGRTTASEGIIEMADGSRGPAFGQAVRDKKADHARQCAVSQCSVGATGSHSGGRR